MRYLLDTDTCVFALRGSESMRDRLAVVDPEALVTHNLDHFSRLTELQLEDWVHP